MLKSKSTVEGRYKMKNKINLKSTVLLLIALFLCGFSVTLYLQANLGSDTVTIFVDGISKTIGTSYGTAALYFNVIIVLLGYLLSPKDMGIVGIIYSVLVGYVIDFFIAILGPYNIAQWSPIIRLMLILGGQLLLTLSYAILIIVKLGMNPLDAMAYGFASKLNLNYRTTRIIMDLTMFCVGWFLGGVAGIGSAIAVLSTGPLVSMYVKRFGKESR